METKKKNGILKNTTRVFKRYCNPILPLYWRFKLPDRISTLREKAFNKSIQSKSIKNYFLYMFSVGFFPTNMMKNDLQQLIENLTLDSTEHEGIKWYSQVLLKRYKKIKDIKYDDRNEMVIEMKNGDKYSVKRLSHVIGKLSETYPEILTTDRYGQCHFRSIDLCLALKDNNPIITTGSVCTMSKSNKFLHSWVEATGKDGQVKCLDFTKNLIMPKDEYYKLNGVKVLEKISRQQLIEDLKILEEREKDKNSFCNKDNFIKLYLSSREEAMKKVEKERVRKQKSVQNTQKSIVL